MPVNLAEVAADYFEIEEEAINTATGTTLLGGTFDDPAIRRLFSRRRHTTKLREYTLRGAVFDTGICTLHAGGRLIAETAYLVDQSEWTEPDQRVDKTFNGDGAHRPIIGFNRNWPDYYHWTAQILPAIDHAIRMCEGVRPLCILPQIGRTQEASLRLLGHVDARYLSVAPHQRVQISTCQYSELLNGTAAFEVSFRVRDTFGRLQQRTSNEASAGERVYVAQPNGQEPRMCNEDQLVDKLRRFGFREVAPDRLSPEEQIAVFGRARAVVGLHGVGLTNIGFCHPGTLVYELIPRSRPNACMCAIAQSTSLIYAADLVDDDIDETKSGWPVNVRQVEARLEELLDLVA